MDTGSARMRVEGGAASARKGRKRTRGDMCGRSASSHSPECVRRIKLPSKTMIYYVDVASPESAPAAAAGEVAEGAAGDGDRYIDPVRSRDVCCFYQSSAVARKAAASLGAKRVLEYQCRKRMQLLPARGKQHIIRKHLFPQRGGDRKQPTGAAAAQGPAHAKELVAQRARAEAHGCEGWQGAGQSIYILDPGPRLKLIDSDKRKGVSQMLLTDMFSNMGMR